MTDLSKAERLEAAMAARKEAVAYRAWVEADRLVRAIEAEP